MNNCPNCGKVSGLHSSILQGCMCQYSMQAPPQRTWVGLTDEEKQEWIDAMPYDPQPRHCMILVNVIEAKLKEKNT